MSADAQAGSCPVCDGLFACERDSPEGCWCAQLEPLDEDALRSLAGLGARCLCPRCLAAAFAVNSSKSITATAPAQGADQVRAAAAAGVERPRAR
jgi:Cysteine-rich CWC